MLHETHIEYNNERARAVAEKQYMTRMEAQ